MSLAPSLVESLSRVIGEHLVSADPGHCLRIDHLSREDSLALCGHLRQAVDASDVDAFVLDRDLNEDEYLIPPERAIEIRNRKATRLCLFIPSGFVDAAASSLANSFAEFDLEDAFRRVASELLGQIPEAVRTALVQVRAQLRGATGISPEEWADYVSTVAADPSIERAGEALWRVGLIPDCGGDEFSDRLLENRRCCLALVHPPRAQASPSERLESTGIRKGAVRDELLTFLEGKRLRDARTWLRGLTEDGLRGRITFERWTFESSGLSSLEEIEIHSLVDKEGRVETFTKLAQPGGAGTQPVAFVGAKRKVVIKWTCHPPNPTNLERWLVELIPSREEHTEEEVAGVELPSVRTSPKTRRASVPLEIDLEAIQVRAVHVRVRGLDKYDSVLRGPDNNVIERLSDEFWLSEEIEAVPTTGRPRRDTAPTLPYARIKAAVELPIDTLGESAGQWSEQDLHYYSVTFNGRRTSRIGLSPVLKQIEQRAIACPDELGRYVATVDIAETLESNDLEVLQNEALAKEAAFNTFVARRKEIFKLIQKQEHRALVETVDWSAELTKRTRAYAASYRDLLGQATTTEAILQASTIDTLTLSIEGGDGIEQAVLMLPTHPLRLLWYAAYADLLRHWEDPLLKIDRKERARLLDLGLLERISPLNFPVFIPASDGSVFLFAQNLRFFWGLALPVEAWDPVRRVADVARLVGLYEDEASLADLPPRRIADELRTYQEVHPYLETLRINVLNPGSGAFVAQAIRLLYDLGAGRDDSEETSSQPARMEILAHVFEPVPLRLGPLADLQEEIYEAQPRGRRHYLAPLFSIALRPISTVDSLPGGDVNVSLAIDQLRPQIGEVPETEREDSASFYGLLFRLLPEFRSEESTSIWQHRIALPLEAARERHPVAGAFTNDLVDTQRSFLLSVGRLTNLAAKALPGIIAELSPEDRMRVDTLHHQSDWVITLDRFFGIEFYDDPGDPNLSRVAKKYLIDYAPEFLEGLGHRMFVTTSHRAEIEEILTRAMRELGFGLVEESVGEVLEHLKTVSGRLALRILGDEARAREAVSLGVVVAYLRAHDELTDSILIPVDAHPELFGVSARPKVEGTPRARCDLIRVRFMKTRLVATFVEVKSRASAGQSEELLNRIVDQIEATEEVFRNLFFRKDPERLDHVLQRSRLATILRFYLRRTRRHGLISSDERGRELEDAIARLESGIPDLRVERLGFVVNIQGKSQRPIKLRDTEIRFITARDLIDAGLTTSAGEVDPQGDGPPSTDEKLFHYPPVDIAPSRAAEGAPTSQKDRAMSTEDQDTQPTAGSISIELGLTAGDDEPVDWSPSVRGSPHLFVLGIPGQGKSWTITRILGELARQGLPALVIDFHGQFGDPSGPVVAAASPIVLNAVEGLPFSPFEAETDPGAGTRFWRTNCFSVAEIFQYVCELGDMQRDVVYEALRDCYVDLGFEDGQPTRVPTIAEVRHQLETIEQQRGIRNVVPRCRPLLEFGLFKESYEQSSSDLQDLLLHGLVVDVHALGLETLQLAAGAFLLRKVYKDMFTWGETDRLRLAIVLDEAHRLARDITLPKIMKEGRKFGIVVVVASQGLADYHPDVVGNAGTKIIFRTNFPMSKKVGGFLRSRKGFDLASAIEQLDVGEAYVQTPEMTGSQRVRMHPLGG